MTRLAEAGCEVPEIATITGHLPKEVEVILDAHYLGWSTTPLSPSWSAPPRRQEPMADKNWKTIKSFQMSPGISS